MLRNFSPNRAKWARGFHLDPSYYDLLTKEIGKCLTSEDKNHDFFQIGAINNSTQFAGPDTRGFLYSDGNLVQLLNSPFFNLGFSSSRLQQTFDYEQNVYNSMTKVFAMSEFLRQSFIKDFSLPPGKVFRIGAGINLDSIPEPKKKDFSRKEILFIGIDFERKGGFVLQEAFRSVVKEYPDVVLNVVIHHILD